MTNLTRFLKSNPILMMRMMTENSVDLGDGLYGKCEQNLHHQAGGTHGDYTWPERTIDVLNFEFFIDGRSVGSLDEEFGGGFEGCSDDDYRLMDSVVDRMRELFPGTQAELPKFEADEDGMCKNCNLTEEDCDDLGCND